MENTATQRWDSKHEKPHRFAEVPGWEPGVHSSTWQEWRDPGIPTTMCFVLFVSIF